jgi:hypothetical protein
MERWTQDIEREGMGKEYRREEGRMERDKRYKGTEE